MVVITTTYSSYAVLDRAVAILDVLAKALAKQGFRCDCGEPDDRSFSRQCSVGLLATKDGERFSLQMREGYTRRERAAQELVALGALAGEFPATRQRSQDRVTTA